jgi:hypothetical protein
MCPAGREEKGGKGRASRYRNRVTFRYCLNSFLCEGSVLRESYPNGILNFILSHCVAFVLLESFYRQNLKPQHRIRLTLIGLPKKSMLG